MYIIPYYYKIIHPILFKIGPFTVYSYGVMLVTAFLVGYYFFSKEVTRKKLNENIAIDITIIAVFCGIAGSKLLFIIENLDEFYLNPVKIAFFTGGFTFLGGLVLSFIASWIYIRKRTFIFLLSFFDRIFIVY